MTRFEYIKESIGGLLNKATWGISEPDKYDRRKLQVTCQGIVLESDYTLPQDMKNVKHNMHEMLKAALYNKVAPAIIIRRKQA